MNILNDEKVREEIADILVSIQDGEGAKLSDLKGIQRAYFLQETDRILTIVALKVFPKYLEKNL